MNKRTFLKNLVFLGSASFAAQHLFASDNIRIKKNSALIVVDVQNCFLEGGTLPVKGGREIIPIINQLIPMFQNVIVTQDWHPSGHISFASSHKNKDPFDSLSLPYGKQVLWPDHCTQGSADAEIDKQLEISRAQLIIRKGFHKNIDSYSAFREADKVTSTGLDGYLKARAIQSVFIVGLATDFCVASTAIDAAKEGFSTFVIEDACRAIDIDGSLLAAKRDMLKADVKIVNSNQLMSN